MCCHPETKSKVRPKKKYARFGVNSHSVAVIATGYPVAIATALKFTVYGHKQASRHTHNFRKCSDASVGLAQARTNYGLTALERLSLKVIFFIWKYTSQMIYHCGGEPERAMHC